MQYTIHYTLISVIVLMATVKGRSSLLENIRTTQLYSTGYISRRSLGTIHTVQYAVPCCVDRGLKPVEKREGGGAHNWGTIADAVA